MKRKVDVSFVKAPQWKRWKMSAVIGLVAAIAGLGVASAQLAPNNRPLGTPALANSDGTECASGIAIDATISMFCSDYCTEHSDCPAGWGCRGVVQGDGETVKLCFPYRHVANP